MSDEPIGKEIAERLRGFVESLPEANPYEETVTQPEEYPPLPNELREKMFFAFAVAVPCFVLGGVAVAFLILGGARW